MTQQEINRLLAGRGIVDEYRAKGTQGIDDSATLASKLYDIGFDSDDPIGEFFAFNESMVLEAFEDMEIQGECDFCVGYGGTPKCVQVWGSQSCYTRQVDPKEVGPLGFCFSILRSGILGNDGASDSWKSTIAHYNANMKQDGKYWFCPEGHGFYLDAEEIGNKLVAGNTGIGKFSLLWR